MKRFFLLLTSVFVCSWLGAQTLVPITWDVYGLTFKAPKGIIVEEDTEDTYLLNNSMFYIEIQSLVTEETGIEMETLLAEIAKEDQIEDCSEVEKFELPHFYVATMKGKIDEDICYNACLTTKGTGDVFYVSIVYNNKINETVPERMLKSFVLDE